MSQIHKQINGLVAALTDPIIVFDPSWADGLPDWLKGEIKLQRLAQLMKGEEEITTDAEALACVSNASLAVPLAPDWVEIYQYLLTRVMKDRVPYELRKEGIDDYRTGLLKKLKQWLWRKRAEYREERAKRERAKPFLGRAEAKAEIQAKAPKQLGLRL